jgi:hypothetical protein
LKIQKSFAKKMESSKWKGTGNERFKRRFFGFRSRTQLPHSNAELLRGSKKKRNEEKVKTEENCARASTREKLAKKVEVSFGSVFVRERTQSARAL